MSMIMYLVQDEDGYRISNSSSSAESFLVNDCFFFLFCFVFFKKLLLF